MDVIVVRDDKIAVFDLFLDATASSASKVLSLETHFAAGKSLL